MSHENTPRIDEPASTGATVSYTNDEDVLSQLFEQSELATGKPILMMGKDIRESPQAQTCNGDLSSAVFTFEEQIPITGTWSSGQPGEQSVEITLTSPRLLLDQESLRHLYLSVTEEQGSPRSVFRIIYHSSYGERIYKALRKPQISATTLPPATIRDGVVHAWSRLDQEDLKQWSLGTVALPPVQGFERKLVPTNDQSFSDRDLNHALEKLGEVSLDTGVRDTSDNPDKVRLADASDFGLQDMCDPKVMLTTCRDSDHCTHNIGGSESDSKILGKMPFSVDIRLFSPVLVRGTKEETVPEKQTGLRVYNQDNPFSEDEDDDSDGSCDSWTGRIYGD